MTLFGWMGNEEREEEEGETVKQRETRGIIHNLTVTNIHSVRVYKSKRC